MTFTIAKSLFSLTVTVGLITGLTGAANAYVQSPAVLSASNGSELAQRPSFPSRPDFDRDDLEDARDRVEDLRDDHDEDDRDDFRDRLEERDEDDLDDFRDRLEDRDRGDSDDLRDRIRGRR